jgi:hypothetical protein
VEVTGGRWGEADANGGVCHEIWVRLNWIV